MQRIGYLYEQVYSFENLLRAFRKAKKGSNKSIEAKQWLFYLEKKMLELQKELETTTYKPGNFRYFKVYDPKERLISVAPFKDRVVHHAVVNILEPVYENIFIHDSYATRKYKGQHKAVFKAQKFMQNNNWFLKCDIEKFFESVSHDILLKIIENKIKDKKLIHLIEMIICNGGNNGIGLPIGNLTSQFFANVYLNNFDHFIKENLRVRNYIRYMDDFVLFSNEKSQLKLWLREIKQYLAEELKLHLKSNAVYINSRLNGLSFLGTRIFPRTIRIKQENFKRYIRRMKKRKYEYRTNQITEDNFLMSMNSYFALMAQYNTYNLRKKIMENDLGYSV